MCGIAGIYSDKLVAPSVIAEMTSCLSHRGPDTGGVFETQAKNIALGHRRLSIIDLSSAANQPFTSSDKRYVVVFNGEIYNYRQLREDLHQKHGIMFRTNSDTEVIAEGFGVWGTALAEKLDGMFALAIVDTVTSKLFLMRDRIGKKPLYYFQTDQYFAFASEIKSLLKDPRVRSAVKINTNAISSFLHLGYIPEPNTIYRDIMKFPAGTVGEVGEKTPIRFHHYWRIEDHLAPKKDWSAADAKDHFKTLLSSAVKKRLLSDVPVGTFLSGGTDSSLITAFASKHALKKLKTFSIGFDNAKHNESHYARAVAEQLGTNHREFILSEKDAIELLERYTAHFDEPFADTSAIPTMMVSKLARQEVKVILTGDGGDELFQGYGAYKWANRLHSMQWRVSKQALHAGFKVFGNNRLKRIADLLAPVPSNNIRSHIFSQDQYFFSQEEIKNKLLLQPENFVGFNYDEHFVDGLGFSEAEKQALFDLKYYLKDDLLVKVDRASMYYGLECRCPLLDHRMIEFAFALPDSLKLRNGVSKWLLKEVLGEFLPASLVHRPKWGFSVPLAKWLKGDMRYLIDQYLSSTMVEEIGLFSPTFVRELVKEFLNGRDYLYNRVWLLIVLHKFWKENSYQV